MLKNAAFAGLLGSLLLLTACETGTPANDGSTPPPTSTAAERKPKATAPSVTPAASPGELHHEVVLKVPPVGTPECDELMEKFKTCLETKVTGTALTSLQFSLEYRLKQWHEINNRRGAAAELLQECTKTRAELRVQLAPYGCEI